MTINPYIQQIITEYEKLAINTSGFIVFRDTKDVIRHIRWSGDIAREVGMLKAPSKMPSTFRRKWCRQTCSYKKTNRKLGSIQVDLLKVNEETMDKYKSLFQYLAQNTDYSRKGLKKNGELYKNGAVGLIKELCYDHNVVPSKVLEEELDYILTNDKVDLRNKQHTLSKDNMLEILMERIQALETMNNDLVDEVKRLNSKVLFEGDCTNKETFGICDKTIDVSSDYDNCTS